MCDLGKVSIIIPVYNVQDYVVECIESVIMQSYENLEIIVVDDGSSDGSGAICDEYEKRDRRIKVVHRVNGGLSAARNTGLDIMTGDYVFFLDGDDKITTDAIEVLVHEQQKSGSDVVTCAFLSNWDKRESISRKVEILSKEVAMKRMFLNSGVGHTAPAKLYVCKLWGENRFPVGLLYEDYATIYYVVAQSTKVSICHAPLYYYRVRQGSIMHSSIEDKNLVLLEISDQVTNYIYENYSSIYVYALRLNLVTYMKTLKNILDVDFKKYPEVQQRIVERVKQYAFEMICCKEVRLIDKVKIIALLLGKRMFYLVYRIGDMKNSVWR